MGGFIGLFECDEIFQVYTLNNQMSEVTNNIETLNFGVKNLGESFDNKLEILRNGSTFH